MERITLTEIGYILIGLFIVALIPIRGVFVDWGKALFSHYFVMSNSDFERVDTDTELPIPEVVPERPNAEHTSTENKVDQPITSVIRHNMKRLDLVAVLAVQKFDNKYVFSANKIAELFAKTELRVSRNVILDEVEQIRNGVKSPTPVNGHTDRPQDGW